MISLRTAAVTVVTAFVVTLAALAGSPLAGSAGASEGAEWRLEQPLPPASEAGVQSETPIGLGRIGDIAFWAPNRGALITDGNGEGVPAGVWLYNGERWHELAKVCGATDGRIAWAGPNEFWTISDGRPGQAAKANGERPPLEDNTLCHFAVNTQTQQMEVVGSYATLAFQASSYQPMDAAACISATDCWFAGAPLPPPQVGAFHLHWNGSTLEAEPNTLVNAVQDMSVFQGSLYESVELPEQQAEGTIEEILNPSVLYAISTEEGAAHPFEALHPARWIEGVKYPLPEYATESYPRALEPLRMSADEDSLWAAAGPVGAAKLPKESEPGELTVLRESEGVWSQVLGPPTEQTATYEKEGAGRVTPPQLASDVVDSIAAEPESSEAWLALNTQLGVSKPSPTELASVAHVAADGSLSEKQLPSEPERATVGPKGGAEKVVCPAQNDCWMATTQGWLFHLATSQAREDPQPIAEPAFSGGYLITFRPRDQGVPQEPSDALPTDDSGLEESPPPSTTAQLTKTTVPSPFVQVSVPLLSDVRTRLVHGSTLELSFHLAVKARVRLVAKRHASVVASTPSRVFKAGKRSLELRLNAHRWPTKLDFQTHALAPLPTVSSLNSGVETVGTSLAFPKVAGITGWGSSL
jgi:hypothetical protein